eukprot:GHVP01032629.1.p1 GENE.GHVP01032629.1~~GHVP01032629.1.p1  ORF type:complete len:539 (-),score=163.28 GHVP01032629.1:3363-4979(-)
MSDRSGGMSVEETNKIRKELGLAPLDEEASNVQIEIKAAVESPKRKAKNPFGNTWQKDVSYPSPPSDSVFGGEIKVGHSRQDLESLVKDNEDLVLTLADKHVLDEENGDEFELDALRQKDRAIELDKRRKYTKDKDMVDYDDYGNQTTDILAKYDIHESETKKKGQSFMVSIMEENDLDFVDPPAVAVSKDVLKTQEVLQSISSSKAQPIAPAARDVLRQRKIPKKKMNVEWDAIFGDESLEDNNLAGISSAKKSTLSLEEVKQNTIDLPDSVPPMPIYENPEEEEISMPNIVDKEDEWLYSQLKIQRKRSKTTNPVGVCPALTFMKKQNEEKEEKDEFKKEPIEKKEDDTDVEFNWTTEFCKTVQTPQQKLEEELERKKRLQNLMKNNHNEEDMEEGETFGDSNPLPEEKLDGGVSGALELFRSKGDLMDTFSLGRHNRQNAPLHTSTGDGDIKLEYRNEFGEVMNLKQAFRAISWKFHGKEPGLKKQEKMMKKRALEKEFRKMPTEQLPSMIALRNSQETDGKKYVVLSSGKSGGM